MVPSSIENDSPSRYLTTFVELAGGLALLAGFRVRIAALVLLGLVRLWEQRAARGDSRATNAA